MLKKDKEIKNKKQQKMFYNIMSGETFTIIKLQKGKSKAAICTMHNTLSLSQTAKNPLNKIYILIFISKSHLNNSKCFG